MKALTFKQYRTIDLALMTILFVIGEAVVTVVSRKVFVGVGFSLSLTIVFLCLVLMRWNGYAAVTAVAGGLVSCLVSASIMDQGEVTLEHFAIYCIGNLLSLSCLLLFRLIGKEKIRNDNIFTIIFVVSVYLTTELGRFLVTFIFEQDINILPTLIATDIMSGVFALVVVISIKKIDGMFEDQKAYLFRLEREKEKDQVKEDEFANRV